MKQCFSCPKLATVQLRYTQRIYCDMCFMMAIQKRIRKELRAHGGITHNAQCGVVDTQNWHGKVCVALLHAALDGHAIVGAYTEKSDYCIHPQTMDMYESSFITALMSKEFKYSQLQEKVGDTLYPLRCVLDEELRECARILNITVPPASSTTSADTFLAQLDTQYPGIKFSLLKSIEQLKDIANETKKA